MADLHGNVCPASSETRTPTTFLWTVWTPVSLQVALKSFLHYTSCLGLGWMAGAPSGRGTSSTRGGSLRTVTRGVVNPAWPVPPPSLHFYFSTDFQLLVRNVHYKSSLCVSRILQTNLEVRKITKIRKDGKQSSDYKKKMTL